jgi:exodeoxyribonuclease-3
VKISTFNINNVNKRLPNLLSWLKSSKPDVVCVQELKCESKDFPERQLDKIGYKSAWEGQKSWNGVAIIAKKRFKLVVTNRRLPGDPSDLQARYIEVAINGVLIASLYAPNGNPQPGPKFDYKLKWLSRLARHAAALKKNGHPIILAGDYNIAPTNQDIYPTKSWAKDALIQPAPRRAFASLIEKGWTDAIRELYGEERIYTFWTYWRNRYERDDGLRLDHFLLNDAALKRLSAGGVDSDVRGKEGASDHAPVWIRI